MKSFFLHVPLQEKILFTKNLALALKSGVSLVNSLRLMQRQAKSGSMKRIVASLMEDANKGVFLSAGLVKFSAVFGELFINIIKVAETSGTLPENLLYLGDELAKKSALRKKVKSALIYPIIILIATIVIGITMIVFVFPKILPLFQNAKVELPLTTRLLISISSIITSYGIWILIGVIAVIIGFRLLLRLRPMKFAYDRILFYAPLFGRAMVNYNMANFARPFALLLRSGVKITEALDIAGAASTNLVYRRHFEGVSLSVRRGEFMSKY